MKNLKLSTRCACQPSHGASKRFALIDGFLFVLRLQKTIKICFVKNSVYICIVSSLRVGRVYSHIYIILNCVAILARFSRTAKY